MMDRIFWCIDYLGLEVSGTLLGLYVAIWNEARGLDRARSLDARVLYVFNRLI